MALSLVTGPQTEPLSLDEATAHLRVDTDDENGLIDGLIQAAREWVESFTHRALLTQTWDLKLDGFPTQWSTVDVNERQVDAGAIWLPKAPLQSVASITYVDTSGASTTWGASNYTVDAPAGPTARMGRVVPAYSTYYPVTRAVPNAVTVRFVAGYTSATTVPAAIKSAMKLLIGHWFSNREAVLVGTRAAAVDIPMGLEALLWPYKAF